jgi:hypothetical protein
MVRKNGIRLGMSLVLFAVLFSGAVFPVAAAGPISVSVADLMPGNMVRLVFNNLPAGIQFAVTMGPAGSAGAGGPTVAHVYSSDGGTVAAWIEILAELRGSSRVDVRIDNGAGLTANTFFNNTSSFVAPVVIVPVTPATVVQSVANRQMTVLHVQRGGLVVAFVKNLPANTRFAVTVGTAGTQGFGGNLVGHLDNGDVEGQDAIGYFEIPENLSGEATLDLRLDAPGYLYLATFKNTDF